MCERRGKQTNMSNYNSSNGTVGGRLGSSRDKAAAGSQFGGLGNHQQHPISFHQSADIINNHIHNMNTCNPSSSSSSSSSLFKFPPPRGPGPISSSKAPALLPQSLNSVPGLNPDVELAVEWSPEEQSILEDGLSRYADEPNIFKYIKISATLPDKTVRDVALRCRWMTKKENGKRRKPEEFYTGKKMKDRKEKPESSSKSSTCSAPPLNMGAYSIMMHHRDQNDRILGEGMSGTTRHLLDENAQFFSHITANLATFKMQENLDLFCRTRNNISAIINDMSAMPGIMSQMPPLPVSINEELANIVLSHNVQTMIYCSPTTIYGKPERRC